MKVSHALLPIILLVVVVSACEPDSGLPPLPLELQTVDDIALPNTESREMLTSVVRDAPKVRKPFTFGRLRDRIVIDDVNRKDIPIPGLPTRVAVDAGHHNYHTLERTYATFGEVLTGEGFDVYSIAETFTDASLSDVDILVIANAQNEADVDDWSLPNYSAFTTEEVEATARWVAAGGALFLVADHMPMAAGGKDLAAAFGFDFLDGFLVTASARACATQTFSTENGRLPEHPILSGAAPEERVDKVLSFCGQAFGYPPDATPILGLDENAAVVLPEESWVWDEETPTIDAATLAQGAVMSYGAGRVAMFGEAQIFTCKSENRGMCHPDATQNRQFLINTFRWLDGEL